MIAISQLDGATYHSNFKIHGGGVGRNIAEGLSKIHGHVQMISKIGTDSVNKIDCFHSIYSFLSLFVASLSTTGC